MSAGACCTSAKRMWIQRAASHRVLGRQPLHGEPTRGACLMRWRRAPWLLCAGMVLFAPTWANANSIRNDYSCPHGNIFAGFTATTVGGDGEQDTEDGAY